MTPREFRRIRKVLGLSQVKLAAELRVTGNTVARWERGEIPINPVAGKLLEVLSAQEQTDRPRARPRKRS